MIRLGILFVVLGNALMLTGIVPDWPQVHALVVAGLVLFVAGLVLMVRGRNELRRRALADVATIADVAQVPSST